MEPLPQPPEAPRATTVVVTPTTAELTALGATVRFSAAVRDQNGQMMAGFVVTWSSSDGSVVMVDASGLVTAVGNGSVTIRAEVGSASGTATVTVAARMWTLSGTVSHGWSVPLASGLDTAMAGDVSGAVVEVIDGADAGRRTVTDDRGRYELEALEEGQFTIRATAAGFAPADRTVALTSDTALSFALSRALPPPRPAATLLDTDPEYLQALKSDYPYVHQVANVRVFSDIDSTFSRKHAEHARLVWDFFDDLYARSLGDHLDAYYTTDSDVFLKITQHCGGSILTDARTVTTCWYGDYRRWFVIPYQIPDFGTQLHEFGHDFLFAVWPAWDDYKWFIEGTAMYFESGTFSDNGSFRVPGPISYCTDLFRRLDGEGRIIPLDELVHLGGDAYLADAHRTYPQSCMLFHYVERYEPGVLYTLIQRINTSQIRSNDQLIAALLELTGKSVSELEEAYESYARIASGR